MGKLLPAFISPPASPPTLSILLLEPRPLVWPRRCFRPLPLIIHFLTRDPRDRPRVAELFIHFFVLLYSSSFLSASSFESFFLSRKKKIYIYITCITSDERWKSRFRSNSKGEIEIASGRIRYFENSSKC